MTREEAEKETQSTWQGVELTDDDQMILRDPIPDIEELEFKLERKRIMVRALWMVAIFLLILTWIVT